VKCRSWRKYGENISAVKARKRRKSIIEENIETRISEKLIATRFTLPLPRDGTAPACLQANVLHYLPCRRAVLPGRYRAFSWVLPQAGDAVQALPNVTDTISFPACRLRHLRLPCRCRRPAWIRYWRRSGGWLPAAKRHAAISVALYRAFFRAALLYPTAVYPSFLGMAAAGCMLTYSP